MVEVTCGSHDVWVGRAWMVGSQDSFSCRDLAAWNCLVGDPLSGEGC